MFILRQGENYKNSNYIGVYDTQEEINKVVSDWINKSKLEGHTAGAYSKSLLPNGITQINYGSDWNFLFSEEI